MCSSRLVNIFGGILKCDLIAEGIVTAAKELDLKIPLVVRLQGTNVERAKKILKDSTVEVEPFEGLDEAAAEAVRSARG